MPALAKRPLGGNWTPILIVLDIYIKHYMLDNMPLYVWIFNVENSHLNMVEFSMYGNVAEHTRITAFLSIIYCSHNPN